MKYENKLWEVLVPKTSNKGTEYPSEHHKVWDEQVMHLTKGMTILSNAKGKWMNLEEKVFIDELIRVRICCNEDELENILITH